MTKTQKYLVYGTALYLVGYLVWKKFYYKAPTVLVSGSSKDTPEQVVYSTGKEMNCGGDEGMAGTMDSMIYLKSPIYIKPKNSIPNVYDRGIGQDVNCSGYMNATGSIQKNCNKINLGQKINGNNLPLDIPRMA